jgi:hypothetical protein
MVGPVQADLRTAPVQIVPTSSNQIGANIIDVFRTPGDATAQDYAQKSDGGVMANGMLELIFWGTAWEGPISPSMDAVIAAAERIIASPYLSELAQYGFKSVTLRGGLLVANDPPRSTYTDDDIRKLISDLGDQGALSEVDELEGRMLYIVFAPPGIPYSDPADAGAHTDVVEMDFLNADFDMSPFGWVNYSANLSSITCTFSHELVELITDPFPNLGPAWHMNRTINGGNELGDACNNSCAIVDGIFVQAYWSERQKACIIPRHAYWTAEISEQKLQVSVNETDTGTTIVKGSGGDCQGGTYTWWRKDIVWRYLLGAVANDYSEPTYSWTVAGQALPNQSNGTIQFQVNQLFPEPDPQVSVPKFGQANVIYTTNGAWLTLSNDPNNGIFDFPATVTVTEANPLPGVDSSSTASTTVSFVGQIIEYDQAYYRDRTRCIQSIVHRVSQVAHLKPFPQPPGPPPPPVWTDRLPAWLSHDTHMELRRLARLAKAAESADAKTAGELRSVLAAFYGVPFQLL